MKSSIFILCLFAIAFWSCSGNGRPSEGQDSASADSAAALPTEEKPARPPVLSGKNRMPFEKKLERGGITFHLSSPNVPEENTLVVAPSGFELRNDTFQIGVEGMVTDAQLADLDQDGFQEVYAFSRTVGSDSTAHVYGFSSFRNRSYGPIGVQQLSAKKDMAEGFNGHGRFYFEDGTLKRSFPIFEGGKATGKNRIITYALRQGEASFILEPVSAEME
ncbi:MAG: hypothetical protein J5I94_04710 [Phaeodactylibacter sp.]|nr:hypothetical protein [Phaeodactylibacter sp.]